METTKSTTAIISRVLRIVYVGVLLAHLLMWATGVKGQTANRMDESSNLSGSNNWGSNPFGCIHNSGVYGLFNSYSGKSHEVLDHKRRHVRDIYNSQIGVREKQRNSGVEVENYLRYVGLEKGNPWCAAFVCWALGEAGVENPGSGWSPDLFKSNRVIWHANASQVSRIKYQESRLGVSNMNGVTHKRGDGIDPDGPGVGDVFGLYFPEKGRIAHVGFVDEWKDGWVTTVEGNTNVLGSREGDGVYRKRRLVRSIYKVARYVE